VCGNAGKPRRRRRRPPLRRPPQPKRTRTPFKIRRTFWRISKLKTSSCKFLLKAKENELSFLHDISLPSNLRSLYALKFGGTDSKPIRLRETLRRGECGGGASSPGAGRCSSSCALGERCRVHRARWWRCHQLQLNIHNHSISPLVSLFAKPALFTSPPSPPAAGRGAGGVGRDPSKSCLGAAVPPACGPGPAGMLSDREPTFGSICPE